MAVVSEVQLEDDNYENRVENNVISNSPGNDNGLTVIETIEDESEDEDVDFNPFLKGSPSEEGSSSLSSEVEGLDVEVVDSCAVDLGLVNESVDKLNEDVGVEVGVSCERELENETIQGMGNGSTSGIDGVEDVFEVPMEMRDSMGKDTLEFDDEDAICKRTRARYSLASFTLDELETFLQETDDDDDLQNVDEEEEYKKFLAAVLKGGDGDEQGYVEGNDDDDDEDNDADFEIEIQEALESDVDDCVIPSQNDEEHMNSSRRPKTRQNRRQKKTSSNKKNGAKQEDRPLRPLIPIVYSSPDASFPCLGPNFATGPSHTKGLPLTGFVAPQIGQLYGLIYEHVQLLVQLYSLCVLDPSRHYIAAQVKGLLSELLHKRDLVLAWKTAAYPAPCFAPQYIDPTSALAQNCIPYLGKASGRSDGQGCRWLPSVGNSVHSVLDVEPLKLVEKYMDDVSNAVREHQKRCVETTNFVVEKQPLFPHPLCPSPELNCNSTTGDDQTVDACAVSPNDKVPKKTLAATLVESTKKQPVAFVPQQIAKLAKPFYPLFNPALFPHKPPPPPVANRVHFTDAEDVLLAMGMMEYNHDWKAIQQRYLPPKSEHQIFVRAKNRSSSKAPDNPIKNVRKFKTSPLTDNEKARIEEGLQMFKLDWTLVWRAVVPYRDPNLIRRQWRIAIGTQKSYKMPSSKKEQHRIYESTRRSKVAAMDNSLTESKEVNRCDVRNINGENGVDNVNEAYVHEAFLADWTPNAAGDSASCRFYEVNEVTDNHGNKGSQVTRDRAQEVSGGSEDSHHMNPKSFQPYMNSKYQSKVSPSKALGREYLLHPQRAQQTGISNLVKLAPELPPVKLPPAVRVISQASLRNSQLVSSTEAGAAGHGLENSVPTSVSCAANFAKLVHNKTRKLNSISPSAFAQNSETLDNRSLTEDRGDNPQMHPLLFRSLEEGHVLSHPVNNSSIIPTFSFFPALQHQMSGDLLRIPHLLGAAAGSKSSSSKEIASTSSSLDFHPFLRRTSDFNAKSFGANSTSSLLTTDLELSRDGYAEELLYRAGTEAAQLAAAAACKPTSPNTDANALDLGIHLSSSRKRKFSSDEGAETAPMVPSVIVGNVVEDAPHHLPELVGAADVGKSSSDGHPAPQLDELGDSSSPPVDDSIRYQPLVEIVMEQEELSDSDEETEDVEFECEEMTDSDKEEGSVAKQIVNTKLKGQEKTTQATDVVNAQAQRSKSGTRDVSEGSLAHRKGKTPRADLARLGKSSTKGSWLSLNSYVSHNTEQAGAKGTESSVGVKPVRSVINRPPPRKPTSSRKKSVGEQKTELSGIDPLSISSRRHIKQAIKTPSTSSPDVAVLNSSCAER